MDASAGAETVLDTARSLHADNGAPRRREEEVLM
jgi:hypothetical protein